MKSARNRVVYFWIGVLVGSGFVWSQRIFFHNQAMALSRLLHSNVLAAVGTLTFSGTSGTLTGNIEASALLDKQNNSYFIDPSASTTSLTTAGKVGFGTTTISEIVNVAGNIGFSNGPKIKDNAGQLQLQAGGATTGASGNGSIYFLDSTGSMRGRFEMAATNDGQYGDLSDGTLNLTAAKNLNTDLIATGRSSYADGIAYRVIAPAASATGVARFSSSVTLSNGIAAGDEVLLINMQGTSADNADVGNFEFKIVTSVTASDITFNTAIAKTYAGTTASNQIVMVQRVPQYDSITIASGGSITASAWDGATTTPSGTAGYLTGIVVFRAKSLTINSGGSITTATKGYRGGTAALATGGEDYRGRTTDTTATTSGSGGSAGTKGTSGFNNGGGGANPYRSRINPTTTASGIYMGGGAAAGGGGGGGGDNNCGGGGGGTGGGGGSACLNGSTVGGNGGSGAAGGGIVFIVAQTVSVSGTISANGGAGGGGGNGGTSGCCDNGGGGGGGGAGGSAGGVIRIVGKDVTLGTTLVTATAGSGSGGGSGASSGNGSAGTGGGTGGTGDAGNIFVQYTNTISGTTNPTVSSSTTITDVPILTIGGSLFTAATQTSMYDLAEYYISGDRTLEAGDVVVISDTKILADGSHEVINQGVLRKADTPYDTKLVGIISTQPGLVLGGSMDGKTGQSNNRMLALAGRVPVKIDPDSLPIAIGDFLTSSTKPGLATKATRPGYVVAKALEDWTPESGRDRIEGFINLTYYVGDVDQKTGQLVTKTFDTITVTDKIVGTSNNRSEVLIDEGAQSVRVDKTWSNKPASVQITPSYDTSVYVTDVSETGFTAHVGTMPKKRESLYWQAVW